MNVKVFDFCGRIEFSRFLICGERDFGQRRPGKGFYSNNLINIFKVVAKRCQFNLSATNCGCINHFTSIVKLLKDIDQMGLSNIRLG